MDTRNLIKEVTEAFITTEAAAELFNLSTARFNGIRKEGKISLERYKVFGRVVYARAEVKEAAANYTPTRNRTGLSKLSLMVLADENGLPYNGTVKEIVERLEAAGVAIPSNDA